MVRISRLLSEPLAREDPSAVSRWERGIVTPSLFSMRLLCLSFDLTPKDLGFPPRPCLVQDLKRSRTILEAEHRRAL
jgi:hypothetical protein